MATNKSQIFETLGDVLTGMAAFAGGSIPATNTSNYHDWIRWIQLAQYDAARRGFWGRLLTSTSITITAGVDYVSLPDNFFKRNGIYVFKVGDVDWNANGNSDNQKLIVLKDPTSGDWICKFIGFTPTENATATLWYFFNPPVPEDQTDAIWLDGEMLMFGALKEYFRQSRQPGSQDDARIEYENRFNENLNLEMLPTPQELMSWNNVYQHLGITPQTETSWTAANRTRS